MPDEKHPGGRPLKFDSVEDLEIRINQYFDDCDKEEDTRVWSHDEIVEQGKKRVCCLCSRPERSKGCMLVSGTLRVRRPYTVTGLAVWLDTSRQTLLEYEIKPEFLDTVKRAKQKIENYAEEKLFDGDYPTRGVIFSLSNNARGWAETDGVQIQDVWDLIKLWIPEYTEDEYRQYLPLFRDGIKTVQRDFDRAMQLFPDVLGPEFRVYIVRKHRNLETQQWSYLALPQILHHPGIDPDLGSKAFKSDLEGVMDILCSVCREADRRRELLAPSEK